MVQAINQTQPPIQQPQIPVPSQVQTPQNQQIKPKSSRTIVAIVVVVILFIITVVSALGYFTFKSYQESSQMVKKVETFLLGVSNNQPETAYNLTSTNYKNKNPYQNFKDIKSLLPAQYSGYSTFIATYTNTKINNGVGTSDVSGIITYENGDKSQVTCHLILENGDWKIDNLNIQVDLERLKEFK